MQITLSRCVKLIKKKARLVSDFRLRENTVCFPQLFSAEDSLYIVNCIYFGQLLLPLKGNRLSAGTEIHCLL
jgi:hypothetical protein